MATISLRAYYSEIESMIERGRTKDAVIHCRQILKFYPKSIDTYRLLGKAYLEAQRFSEGADVLQRVLSAVPDDFVSQIGLSIIREDEGNLDAALWHMERAFEAQPSNKAVQDELRRLYGRRDGVQPSKIRLTRGALVRMYARGDLFQQAIAEARMALVEQPDRVDIELILARMYYLSNQKISATEICNRLLTKLPFCYEANKILIEILPGTARQDDVEVYKRRLFDLDPYLEFTPPGALSSIEAPEESVMVEALELDEARLAAEHPELAGDEEERLPDWLAALESREAPADELSQIMDRGLKVTGIAESLSKSTQPGDPIPNEEEQIPVWMKDAGWQPAEDVREEAANIPEEVADEIASEAEIPEWLQSIAPGEETPGLFGTVESSEDEEDTRWLESILEGEVPEGEALESLEAETPAEVEPVSEEIIGLDLGIPIGEVIHPLEEIASLEAEPEPFENAASIEQYETEVAKEPVPDWLASMAAMDAGSETEEPAEELAPDNEWLKSLAEEKAPLSEVEFTRDDAEQPLEIEPKPAEEAVEGIVEVKIDTDWLKRLPIEEETGTEATPEVEETVLASEFEPETSLEPGEFQEAEAIEEVKIDTDWLNKLGVDEEVPGEMVSSEQQIEVPPETEPQFPQAAEKESGEEFKITTDWLKSLPEDKEEELPSEEEVPTLEEVTEGEGEETVESEAFAADADFLKRLAMEEAGAAEIEPVSLVEEPFEVGEGLPEEAAIEELTSGTDWLKELAREEGSAAELSSPEIEAESIEVEPLELEGEQVNLEEVAADADWLSRLPLDQEVPSEGEPEPVANGPVEEGPLEQVEETLEELPEIEPESVEIPEAVFEETPLPQPLTAEQFLSEIEKAVPPEADATQPARITPPPFGGEPVEEFLARLEEPEAIQPEVKEDLEEFTGLEEKLTSDEIGLTTAELEEILPEVVTDNNLDRSIDAEIPEWLKESLEIEAVEALAPSEEEAPGLEGIPGAFTSKTPEDLAFEEIMAATEEEITEETTGLEQMLTAVEELPVEEPELLEEDLTVPEVLSLEGLTPSQEPLSEPEMLSQAEELAAEEEFVKALDWGETAEVETFEAPAEPFEATEALPDEIAEAAKLEVEERQALLGWLAEDLAETESELEEEEDLTFEPPVREETEWIKEETLAEPVEPVVSSESAEAETEPTGEIEPQELPDWLMALAEEEEPQPVVVEPKEEAVPEWLKDLEEEPEVEGTAIEQPFMEEQPAPVVEESPQVAEWSFEAEETPAETTVEDTSPVRVSEPPSAKTTTISESSDLYHAQAAMNAHDLETALSHYNQLIERDESLDDIIHDLRDALYHYPVDISIWQALGDAYMRSNRLQDALDAYTKAEELMR